MAVSPVRSRLGRYDLGGLARAGLGASPVPQMRTGSVGYDPAEALLAGWVTGGLVLAAWLHREGHSSMCSVLRTPPWLLGLGVFLLHLADLLGRWDPINYLSRKIPVKQ